MQRVKRGKKAKEKKKIFWKPSHVINLSMQYSYCFLTLIFLNLILPQKMKKKITILMQIP